MTAYDHGPGDTHALQQIRTVYEYEVTGKPDTRGPAGYAITIRPEKVTLRFDDGELRYVGVFGRTVRRSDGAVTKYRQIGFTCRPYHHGGEDREFDPLPNWLAYLLTREGIHWPAGRQPNPALDRIRQLLPGPCPIPDVFNGFDECVHNVAWDQCDMTAAIWIAHGIDPQAERERLLEEARREYFANQEPLTTHLIWSNEGQCWWKGNGSGYTGDVWNAGRYTAKEAAGHVRPHIMASGDRGPKDVVIPAPELDAETFTSDALRRLPGILHQRAREAVAAGRRDAATGSET